MKRILKRNKSKGKGVVAESSSVVSADGTITGVSGTLDDYIVKEKDLLKIHKAAWNGDLSKIRNFGNKRQDLNALDKANRTPLHLACYNGHTEIVKYLIGNSAKLNVCDGDQRSPLMRAIQRGHLEIAESLLRRNADPSLIDVNADTALHVAVSIGRSDAVALLLSYGAQIDAANKQGRTPLHLATIQANSEILELLLENQADVNVQDISNRTALMIACQSDQIGIVKTLLEYKADPNIRDQKGWTANDHAIMGGFHGCSHLIEEQQTMKRASAGSALSGTGLFGSTNNSVIGFPHEGEAVPSDISGDNEEDLSINRKSDDDSWPASNSEVEAAPKKGLKLSNVKKLPSLESQPSDKDRHKIQTRNEASHISDLERNLQRNNQLSPRSVSDNLNEEKTTPRRRHSSKGLISSGTISDWDDDSDILDDLSDKKNERIPLKFGKEKHSKDALNSPSSPIKEMTEGKGFPKSINDKSSIVRNDDESINNPKNQQTQNQVKGQQGSSAGGIAADYDDVFNENSDSDWDSEADDILPSDNSGGNGYTASQVKNNNLVRSEKTVSAIGNEDSEGKGKVDAKLLNESPNSEEEDDFDEMENEEVKEANESLLKSVEESKPTDENTKQFLKVANEKYGDNSGNSLAEANERQKMLENNLEKIKREKNEIAEEKKKQEKLFHEQRREQEELNHQRLKQMQELEAAKSRAEENQQRIEKEKQRIEEESKRKEEFMKKELELKMKEAKELEEVKLEEERQKMQDELMRERHKLDEERKLLEQRQILQEEEEKELQDARDNAEIERLRQKEREKVEEELAEEKKALETEKEQIKEERQKQSNALKIERQKLEQEIHTLEEAKKEASKMNDEKRKLEEQRMELEESATQIKREQQRMEEERRKLEQAQREVDEMKDRKRQFEEDREKLEADKIEAGKVEKEWQKLKDERVSLEVWRKEAEKVEIEKKKLEEEKKYLLDEVQKDKERIEKERIKLNEEKELLEEAKKQTYRLEVMEQQLEEQTQLLNKEKEKAEIDRKARKQFDEEKKNLEEERKTLEAFKKGETNLVEFERKKLMREKEQLIQNNREEAEKLNNEKNKLEAEKRNLEEMNRKEKEERVNEKMKLQDQINQMQTKVKEDENNLRNMERKVKELIEKNLILEGKVQNTEREEQHGESKGVIEFEPNIVLEETGEFCSNLGYNGVIPKQVALGSEISEEGEPVLDENLTDGIFGKPKRTEAPQGLLGGAGPRIRRSQKMTSLNLNSNGSPAVQLSDWQELLEEHDGLDYSSSSMGDEDEDENISNLLPVGASTPVIPTETLPLSSTFQQSRIDVATHIQNTLQDLRFKIAKEKQSSRLYNSKLMKVTEERDGILMKVNDLAKERQEDKNFILEMEKKLQSLIHEVELEQEKRCTAEMLLKKTKEQILKREHQLSDEQHAREQAELALCKLQVDYQMSQNAVQQLEAEREELRHQLLEKESKHKYQQRLMETQQLKQEAIYETGSVVLLEAADESRKAAWSQSEKLKEELFAMKVAMERLQFQHKGNEGILTGQIQDLESKLADLQQDQVVCEDALHHASQAFHAQLTAVKIENSQLKSSLEQEQKKSKELNEKVECVEKEVLSKQKELEDLSQKHQEFERMASSEIEKISGYLEGKQIELLKMQEETKSNEKALSNMEDKIIRLKHQLGISNASLLDKTNQLQIFQQEMDKKLLTEQGHDKIIHMEREEKAKAIAKAENVSESLRKSEQEVSSLKATLESMKAQTHQKERESENDKERLNSTISAVQKEKDQVRTMYEEKHTSITGSLQTLKDSLMRAETDVKTKEADIGNLQQQLNQAEKKLCMSEANLVVLQKECDSREKDAKDSRHEIGLLKDKISNLEVTRGRLESQLEDTQKSLRDAERKVEESYDQLSLAKKSVEQMDVDTKKYKELEREKAKLEVIIEQEKDRNSNLKKELEHSIQMRNSLELTLMELKNTNVQIGEQLSVESATRNLMSQEVEDHKELWESEIKSKSKLGLRLAQLQRYRVNQQGQLEEEKQKNLRATEVKEQLEGKLESEKERNRQLTQTIVLLKSKLKLSKKRLKDLEFPDAKMQTLQADFERERFNLEAALATQRKQLENTNEKLQTEMAARKKLEKKNTSLQLQLASLQSLQKQKADLAKENKRLETELSETKRDMNDNYIEKSELELYKKNLDLQTKLHLNEKLAQVNNYLDEQTSSRNIIDKTEQNIEAEVRKKLEESLNDLKRELANVRSSKSDIETKKETLEVEVQRTKALLKQECERGQRLEEEIEHLQRKVRELESRVRIEQQKVQHQRSELSSLETEKQKVLKDQPKGVDDITQQVREELNRSISRHMEGASTEFDFQLRGRANVFGNYNGQASSPTSSYLAVLKKNYFV